MATTRIILTRAKSKGHSVKLSDISRAFLYTPCKANVYVEHPAEHNTSVPNMGWKLDKVVYGLEEAMVEFERYSDEVACGRTKARLRRGSA